MSARTRPGGSHARAADAAAAAFDDFASSHGGAASREVLARVVEALGESLPLRVCDEVIERYGVSGVIGKSAFLEWWRSRAPQLDAQGPGSARGGGARSARSELRESASQPLLARNERKRAEADVQLLANRLAHLRMEEERARKKAEETLERARRIAEMKQRRQQELEDKERARLEQAERERASRERVAREREAARSKRIAVLGSTFQSKRGAVSSVLDEREQHRQEREQLEAERAERNRQRHEAIRRAEELAKGKKARAAQEERQRLMAECQARMQAERSRLQAAEADIARMEAEERALIDRLRQVQQQQRDAYADLELALQEDG